jgi:hypothetical protein
MSIDFSCPGCGKPYQLKDELAGKTARCSCGERLTIPTPTPEHVTADLINPLGEIAEPVSPPSSIATDRSVDANLQKVGALLTGNRAFSPLSRWLENTQSVFVKIFVGVLVGVVLGVKVIARDKGAPQLALSWRIITVLCVAAVGAAVAGLLVVADTARDRVKSGQHVPMLVRWYFAAGWKSAFLWILTTFAAVILWLCVFAAMQ